MHNSVITLRQSQKPLRILLLIIDHIIPIPLFITMVFLWNDKVNNAQFVLYISLLPTFLGYVVPFIAINYLKMWKFNSNFLIFNIYPHHGFLISPYSLLFFYLLSGLLIDSTLVNNTLLILSASLLQSLLSSVHDYCAIKTGNITIFNTAMREGQSSSNIIASFSFIGFAVIGAMHALSVCIAYYLFIVKQSNSIMTFFLLFLTGVVLCGVIPAILYSYIERKNIGKEVTI